MALTDCFIQPGSLQGLMTCLRESENLTGVAVVAGLLTAWLVIQLMAQRGRKAHRPEAMDGVPVMQTPERFGDEKHAEAVYTFANREMYQLLLAEMEKALTEAGYRIKQKTSCREELKEPVLGEIGGRIYRVRERFMAPMLSDDALNENTLCAVRQGFAQSLLTMLIRANEAQGCYVQYDTRSIPWQDFSWPLKQVVVTVSASAPVLTRDMVRVLSEASRMLEEMAFQPWEDDVRKPVPVTTSGIQAELIRQSCATQPGFFPEPVGRDVPAGLEGLAAAPAHDVKRTVSVFVQVTKRKNTRHIVAWLKEASERIGTGEACGADYDDDNGYAFIVSSPSGSD